MELKNRSEVVFLYDVRDANPNGDPDENKPRMDEETEINIVTDVRLKRTIRDYLLNYKEKDVWIREEFEGKGTERKTREEKLDEVWEKFEIKNREEGSRKLLEQYIDLRLFGATIAGKKEKVKGEKVFTWVGPVQFNFGRSLHKVEPVLVKGTSVLPTEEKKAGGAFTEAWILPYSLISFYGVINENAAKTTKLREEDVNELLDGIWNGTKNLITRSKFGQVPRFLIRVVYNEGNYHIGDLDKKIKLLDIEGKEVDKDGKDGKALRSIQDVKLDVTELIDVLKRKSKKIKEIQIETNDDVVFVVEDVEAKGKTLMDALGKISELKEKVKMLNIEK
ncbi:MAG: type I-B CRISPR-associated protein Cas7/Csh2 [Candidatus Cloacimonas sp. 4484_209]|nr:MAG: type I-B CRISPR-associated protein Cas7/Csh2 [Candidatus Cloacimonas sp. 4484_209]